LFFLKKKDIYKNIYFDETSCCASELYNFFTSKFDSIRLNYKRTFSIELADIIIICGYCSKTYLNNISSFINKKKNKIKILAIGGCAISGGPLDSSTINADLYVPGCPPKPESIVHALLTLKKIKR
jgi:NADH-quinone oxidoreductase subunit B